MCQMTVTVFLQPTQQKLYLPSETIYFFFTSDSYLNPIFMLPRTCTPNTWNQLNESYQFKFHYTLYFMP